MVGRMGELGPPSKEGEEVKEYEEELGGWTRGMEGLRKRLVGEDVLGRDEDEKEAEGGASSLGGGAGGREGTSFRESRLENRDLDPVEGEESVAIHRRLAESEKGERGR